MGVAGGTTRFHGRWRREREEELRLLAEAKTAGRFQRIEPAEALRTARRDSGLSIEAFARCLNLYPAAVACWESGKKPAPWWVVRRLQRFHMAQAA